MLKKLRIIVSTLFFITWLAIFLTEISLFIKWAHPLGKLQVIPGFLSFFANPAFPLGLLLILTLTFLFGRVYCSSLCPLGTLQDTVIGISLKVKKGKYKKLPTLNILRYGTLSLTILSAIFGILIFIQFLGPYSLFGKITSDVFSPILYQISVVLEETGTSFIPNKTFHMVPLGFLIFISIMFASLILASFKKGRLYCNSLCPVGSFLGLISKASLFQIRIKPDKCVLCGKCEQICKAGCVDYKNKSIDFSRCVTCFNCLNICPENAIAYQKNDLCQFKKPKNKDQQKNINESRRLFLENASKLALTLGSAAFLPLKIFSNKQQSAIPKEVKKFPVTPPGSKSLKNFSNSCISCHLCVSHCPTKVLVPAFNKFGLAGFMQPHLNYSKNYCEFECNSCSKVCPTGAIQEISLKQKQKTQIGQVKLFKPLCLVYDKNLPCGACAEVCPTTAVKTVPYMGSLYGPVTNETLCIGCGHCEFVCPAKPKAIYVQSNLMHSEAVVLKKGEIQQDTSKKKFPF